MGKPYLGDTVTFTVEPARGKVKRVRRRSIGGPRYYVRYRRGYTVHIHARWLSGATYWRPFKSWAERKGSFEALKYENEMQAEHDRRQGNLKETFAPGVRV